ncbi:MAG TPA: RidA family protein [Chloroflexota bacterium]|jgi:enamine deaminase RidA (YjgF/YER057c/UK114 family)
MHREVVQPPGLGAPIGPYSHVFSVDVQSFARLVFIAGQVAFDRDGNLVGPNDMRAQFGQVYANLQAAVEAAGGTMTNIVCLRTFLTRADDLPVFNACRAEHYPRLFPDGVYPPNTLLIINRLVNPALLLEIEAVAAI